MKKIAPLLAMALVAGPSVGAINPDAEKYLSKMLEREVPYEVEVLGRTFVIRRIDSYPPGKLTAMFAQYLLDNELVAGKVVADIGCGCFALGIIAAQEGAKEVLGLDANPAAIESARENIQLNLADDKNVRLFCAEAISLPLPEYVKKVDLIVAGLPWDSISAEEYASLPPRRQPLSRSFYDVNDQAFEWLLTKGFELLSPGGKIFITSCQRVFARVERLTAKHGVDCVVVKKEDLHRDGNLHYIVGLSRKGLA